MSMHSSVRTTIAVALVAVAPATAATSLQSFSDELQQLVNRVSPAVVQILTTGVSGADILTSSGDLQTYHGGGSVVILDPD